ncbi:MAG: AAA family ATPase, partial [Candidatus Velamenicoccus archaeovorus]
GVDTTGDLRLLLASRHTLIVAEMQDEQRFLQILRRAADAAGIPVWTWTVTRGLARDLQDPQMATTDPRKALDFIASLTDPGVFVLADVHVAFGDPVVVRRIKEIAQRGRTGQTLVLTGPRSRVPPELEGLALPWTLEPPGREELSTMVRRTLDDLAARNLPVSLDAAGIDRLVEAVLGLTVPEAEHLVLQAAFRDGRLDESDVTYVRGARAELLEADGVLELIPTEAGDLADVGGMQALKEWLRIRGRAFEPAARGFGLDPPKGVLLTGVPGCGKSLVAKALARSWRLPLVLLDPGRLFGSFVGESEARLGSALATVEAMSPVVLWVDEIEKGFATSASAGDGGVSQRLLGTFLRWMQERPAGAFLAATCNDPGALPAEFLRRGRFDQIFFVDLPGEREREEILRIQLRRRARDPAAFDLQRLAAGTEGFSGAELEAAVVGALYRAYADGTELTTEAVADEIAATTPLSRTRAEDVARIRAWAVGRATPAARTEGART